MPTSKARADSSNTPEECPSTILIIEDNPSHRHLFKAVLARRGTRFLEASNAHQGFQLASKHRPDLVLLDIMMSPGNSWDTLKKLKTDTSTRDIPIIVVTVLDEEARARQLGADGYLMKPVGSSVLRQEVSRYIDSYLR